MAPNLTAQERRDLAQKAYRMMLNRINYTEINRKTAGRLIKEEEMARLREERGASETEQLVFERDRAVDTYTMR